MSSSSSSSLSNRPVQRLGSGSESDEEANTEEAIGRIRRLQLPQRPVTTEATDPTQQNLTETAHVVPSASPPAQYSSSSSTDILVDVSVPTYAVVPQPAVAEMVVAPPPAAEVLPLSQQAPLVASPVTVTSLPPAAQRSPPNPPPTQGSSPGLSSKPHSPSMLLSQEQQQQQQLTPLSPSTLIGTGESPPKSGNTSLPSTSTSASASRPMGRDTTLPMITTLPETEAPPPADAAAVTLPPLSPEGTSSPSSSTGVLPPPMAGSQPDNANDEPTAVSAPTVDAGTTPVSVEEEKPPSQEPGGLPAEPPHLPPSQGSPPSKDEPMSFASTLQALQRRYQTQPAVDFFVDPKDPKTVATSLQLPEQPRPLLPATSAPAPPGTVVPSMGSLPTTLTGRANDARALPPLSQPVEQVMTLRRAKSSWEKAKDVSLFANSSDDEDGNDGAVFSDDVFSTGDISVDDGHGQRRGPFLHIGTRRTNVGGSFSVQGVGADQLDEASAAEAAAQRARAKMKHKLAKDAAKRMIYKNLEHTVTSASSGSQQGVSVSSTSGCATPHQATHDHKNGRKSRHAHTDGRLQYKGAGGIHESGSDEEVLVDGDGTHLDGAAEGVGADNADSLLPTAPLVPYVPTLRGPVSTLKALYAADTNVLQRVLPLFSWRPPFASTDPSSTKELPFSVSQGWQPPAADEKPFADSDERSGVLNTALSVTIRGMSPLHADVGVVHPFVRVWFVHCVTGENFIQSGAAVPCAITHPYDLRAHGSRSPWWEAEVALRLDTDLVRRHHKTGVLLFEVLDCGNETIHGFFMLRSGLYPIGWGFLMLHDCFGLPGVLFRENVHVQLYRYPMRTPWYVQWLQNVLPPWLSSRAIYAPTEAFLDESGVLHNSDGDGALTGEEGVAKDKNALVSVASPSSPPAVFFFFKSPVFRNLTYDGGLVVTVKAPQASFYVPKAANMLPYEEYLLNLLVAGGGSCAVPRRESTSTSDGYSAMGETMVDALGGGRGNNIRTRAMLRSMSIVNPQALGQEYVRKAGERTVLPTTSLQTAPVPGVVTCMAFFHLAPILALGVTRHLQYVVELRNALQSDMPVLAQLHGLTGHIHSVAVQREDRFVLAGSADKTVRVWRVTDLTHTILAALEGAFGAANAAQLVVEPVCVLPHAYPVYSAIFHQDTVITAGYNPQLQVWRYDRLLTQETRQDHSGAGVRTGMASPQLSPNQASLSRDMASSLQLTATFTPGLHAADQSMARNDTAALAPHQLGELIFTTDAENDGVVLSVASNERAGRVWSVTSGGTVYCWRALYEVARRPGHRERGDLVWQMSVRHNSDCNGASRVEVAGAYAVVTCLKAPIVYVFDATTCESIRVVNTRQAPSAPVRLLPDGEAFVAGTGDGNLAAWDCADGALCTPSQGDYNKVKTKFPIVNMTWADGQQLAALQSPAPCPRSFLPTYGVEPPLSLPAAALRLPHDHVPTEVTMIAIVGAARSSYKPILISDTHASDDFCLHCGGDVSVKRRAAQQAARTRALRRQQAEHKSRKSRLYNDDTVVLAATTSFLPHPAYLLGGTTTTGDMTGARASVDTAVEASHPLSGELGYADLGLKVNSILNFWRGLVRQHRHTGGSTSENVEEPHRGESRPVPLAERAGRYAAREHEYGHNDDEDTLRE